MKQYNRGFREEAVKLSNEIGVKDAAKQLGIPYYTLTDWRSSRRQPKPEVVPSKEEQNRRILELEKENAELRNANEILKDALGFFAKDRKK
jgi:transposase